MWATFQEDVAPEEFNKPPAAGQVGRGRSEPGFNYSPDIPLRTLDAAHLVIAREIPVNVIATADRVMQAAAKAMGFSVAPF